MNPDALTCPILGTLMSDPVIAADGHSYERRAIEEWFRAQPTMASAVVSPMTGQPLASRTLIPNIALRKAVRDFVAAHPQRAEELDNAEDEVFVRGRVGAVGVVDAPAPPVVPASSPDAAYAAYAAALGLAPASSSTTTTSSSSFAKTLSSFASSASSVAAGACTVTPSNAVAYAKVVDNIEPWEFEKASLAVVVGKASAASLVAPPTTTTTTTTTTKRMPSAAASSSSSAYSSSTQAQQAPMSSEPRNVVVAAGRASNYTGGGVLAAWETKPDGSDFRLAWKTDIKAPASVADASVSCLSATSASTIVAGSRDGTISIWEAQRNKQTGALALNKVGGSPPKLEAEKHRDVVTCVRFHGERTSLLGSPLPDLVASSSRDSTVRLWRRAASGEHVWLTAAVLRGHRSEVWCVSSSTGHIVSGGDDWSLFVWDPESPTEPVARIDAHTRAIRCCDAQAESPHVVASGSLDETVRVWDLRTPPREPVARLEAGSMVLCLRWGLGFLCAGGGIPFDTSFGTSENVGGWLRVWDPRTWQVLGDAARELPRPTDRWTPSLSSTSSATSRADGDVNVARQAHSFATNSVAALPSLGNAGPAIVSGGDDRHVRVWCSRPILDGALPPFFPRPTLAYDIGADALPLSVDAVECLWV